MENNIDENSFNDWDLSKEKTRNESKRAYLSASDSSIKSFCEFKTAWTSRSFLGAGSMIMNKKSQFTKFFGQAILDMKDTGRLDIYLQEKSINRHKSCNLPDLYQKHALGYEKLTFLFVVLVSGIFTSLFIVLFESLAKMYLEELEEEFEAYEINPVDDHIEEFLEGLSADEIEIVFQRVAQKRVKTQ